GFRAGGRGVLLKQVSDRRAAEIEGSADSEVLFAMVLDRLDAGEGPPEALQAVVETVLELTGGRRHLVLTDGRAVPANARLDVLAGLTSSPKELPPRWFYDEAGCALFDDITRLDEYYLTRREREILDAHAPDIAAATGADTLVELGSGTSEKTRLLLDALAGAGTLQRFVAFDTSD